MVLRMNTTNLDYALLEKSIYFAVQKHHGQVDKGGHPYILHPLRVMQGLHTIPEKITGVLHDVLEDTDATPDELRELGIPEFILEALHALTKYKNESKEDAAKRAAQNSIARAVKLQDVTDNMDLSRLQEVTDKDLQRLEKYKVVKQILETWN